MEYLTMKKKIEILEHAFAAAVGAYYSINLTKDLVPGSMYQVIDDTEYSLNEQMSLPENARFSDVVRYWGNKLSPEEQESYFEFFSISNLLAKFQDGQTHVFHRYWTQSAVFEPMFAEQHIVMYKDEENEDILAVSYVLDLTQKFKEEKYKKELEKKQQELEEALQEARQVRKLRELQVALKAVDDILDNIALLDNISSEAELNQVMPDLLAALGRYSVSDRAYIFTWTSPERNVLRMTHEWCAEGVSPTMGDMQNLKMEDMPNWSLRLNNGEAIISKDWDAEKEKTPEEYALFDGQDIHSLIVIPILSSKKLNGYIGFDNPEQSKTALSVRLLTSVGGHIGGLKENLIMMKELEKKQESLKESLDEIGKEKKILEALSVDYTSVYYCDLLNDTILAVKECDYTNSVLSEKDIIYGLRSYSYRLQYYYDHYVIHESAPDFLQKLSADSLRKYLIKNNRFGYRFRTRPNKAGQQCFEVQIVRLSDSDGFKVVMGYRYIDDIVAEQEKQKIQLENALANATLNSEIIDSISKIYWLIYRMDLMTGIYEEVSAGHEMHKLTGKRGNTEEVFKEICGTIVSKQHQKMMEKFLDTSTLAKRLRDTESIAMEYCASSGSWHLARFIVKKRDKEGNVINVLYVVRQIDQQKQQEIEYKQKLLDTAEEARRANIAKTDFLRRMSHDIRTPINGIQGMLAIADHYPEDMEKQKECRDKVKEAAGFLIDLVNSILDMNKLESGTTTLEHTSFDLITVLQEVNGVARMNAELRGLTISVDHSKIKHSKLLGSPLHLKQILQNIDGNAIKYNRVGGAVSFSTEEVACENGKATYKFRCSDTGRGMSKDFISHVFEPFAQEDSSARTSYMGTGLGMAIAKQLTEMMGGNIAVESELDIGTTFTVTIPFELDSNYKETYALENVDFSKNLSGLKVLLVEDNELNMEIAKFILENVGIEVTMAKDGREAVNIFEESRENYFDVILMDIMMPVMDGLTATKTIRSLKRQEAKTIPIFAMTANAFLEDKKQSQEAGMNEHLSKPLDEKKLTSMIWKYTIGKRQSS